MGIFESNIGAMRKGFPELYERFSNIKPESIQGERIAGHISEEMTDEWLSSQPVPEFANILIFGLANGTAIRKILSKTKTGAHVLVYEPSVFNLIYTLGEYDISFCFENGVRLIVDGLNDDLFAAVMEEMLDFNNYKDYRIYLVPGVSEAFPEQRKRFVEHFVREGVGWMESRRSTEKYWLHHSVKNLLNNIKYLSNNTIITRLYGCLPKDIPYILVGAGPSLSEIIEKLKACKDRAYIIAADTAIPYMLENELIPDAFVSIEADKRGWELFCDERITTIPMFSKVNTLTDMLKWHRGRKIFLYDNDEFVRRVYREYNVPEPRFRGGLNGLTTVFAALDEISVDTVMLAGQDMCFGAEGNTHATDRGENVADPNKNAIILNNEGKEVMTRSDWLDMIRWYENALYDTSINNVFNLSKNGALVNGAGYMDIEEVMQSYRKTKDGFSEIIESAPSVFGNASFEPEDIYNTIISDIDNNDETEDGYAGDLINKYLIADEMNDMIKSRLEGQREIKNIIRNMK